MTRPIQFGIDRLLADPALRKPLAGRRVALLAHPASVTADLTHSLDALAALPDLKLTAAFGPQHGLRGDKQDNMVESPDFRDPQLGIPGLQPLRRSAPADRRDDGQFRRAARRPAGPRLPHLHLHHHAALRAGSGGAARQDRSGCSTARTRPAGRSKV